MGGKTTIQAAPTTPPPSASETAADIYKAKLEYEPKMAAIDWATQQQYMPLQTALYSQLYGQYYPEYARSQQTLQRELYPQQSQILEAGATQALQGLQSPYQQQILGTAEQQALQRVQQPENALLQAIGQRAQTGLQPSALTGVSELEAIRGLQPNALLTQAGLQAQAGIQPSALQTNLEQQALIGLTPTGYTPEQQVAIEAIRGREQERLARQMRERANIGGTLYGGRAGELESRAAQELAQRFAAEDIDRIERQRQVAMQQALAIQSANLAQRQQALAGLTGAGGLQEQARQQALQQLYGATQLGPGLQREALATAGGIYGLQEQARQQALQNAMALRQQVQTQITPYLQILYPQIGAVQPSISPYQYQSAVPSPDNLYSAMFQASQPQYFATQKPDYFGPLVGLGGSLGSAAILGSMLSSKRYKKNIKLWEKPLIYSNN